MSDNIMPEIKNSRKGYRAILDDPLRRLFLCEYRSRRSVRCAYRASGKAQDSTQILAAPDVDNRGKDDS
jgi:hypothetical protein